MSDIFRFTQTPIPPISEVGGKAHSLITMSNAGFVVPNGFVCGAGFFKPWNELVEKSSEWHKLQDAIAKEAELSGHVEEREKAYKKLLEEMPNHESKKLKKYYQNIHRFAPSRDTLKYIFVLINHTLRKLVLRDGGKLVAAGKIEMVEDVFFLTFEELAGGGDLKKLIAKRKPFFQEASANVQTFPIFIDSRGRIVTAEAEQGESDDPNILKGNGISRGVVRGRVKVLKDPREKKIEKGDILVTYNTDPGWTPLFVGASGIILEIGAVLQHGGVVAREYAKPCVAGIHGITEKLHDGQEVEVDGTNGIVKILD